METIIVASIVLIALGALATFAMVELLPQELLSKAENHGRFAGLGVGPEVATQPPDATRLNGTALRNRAQTRRHVRLLRGAATVSKIAWRRLANGR